MISRVRSNLEIFVAGVLESLITVMQKLSGIRSTVFDRLLQSLRLRKLGETLHALSPPHRKFIGCEDRVY